jgi:hypothetical protein
MNDANPPRRLGRSLLALLAGMLVGIILSIGTDVVLHVIGLFPPLGEPVSSPPLALATVYRSVYGVIASYVAARGAQPAHDPCAGARHAGVCGEYGWGSRDVEQGAGVRAPLVSGGAGGAGDTDGVVGREVVLDAGGALGSWPQTTPPCASLSTK